MSEPFKSPEKKTDSSCLVHFSKEMLRARHLFSFTLGAILRFDGHRRFLGSAMS